MHGFVSFCYTLTPILIAFPAVLLVLYIMQLFGIHGNPLLWIKKFVIEYRTKLVLNPIPSL